MTHFNIDLSHPGEFARTWVDRFVGPQGKRRLILCYVLVGLLALGVVGLTFPKRYTVYSERQRINKLKIDIDKLQKDRAQQEGMFQGVSSLDKYQVVWSEVLHALSQGIPGNLWLNRIELAEPVARPTPKALTGVAGQKKAEKPGQILRLEIGTELRPGAGFLVDVAKFLDGLGQDSKFSKRFQMEDWEASSASGRDGEQEKQEVIITVSFKVL